MFSARRSAALPPDTILFHRKLSSEKIASLAPLPSLHKGCAIDCDSVPVRTGRFLERRDQWEHNCYLAGSNQGRGAGAQLSSRKKLTLLLEHLPSGLGVPHRGVGNTAVLPPWEQAAVIPSAMALQPLMEKQRAADKGREWIRALHLQRRHQGKGWWRECRGAAVLLLCYSSKVHLHCNHRK